MIPTSWKSQYADWDEMVFADREKGYGAYDLRKRYPRHLLAGLGGAILLGAFMLAWPSLNALWAKPPVQAKEVLVISEPINLPPVEEESPQELTPPPLPPEPPKLKQLASLIPEPTADDDLDPDDNPTINTMDSLLAAPNIGLDNIEGKDEAAIFENIGDGDEDIPQVIVEQTRPGFGDFVHVDEEPVPLNMLDIQKAISFPQMARDANIHGTVVFRVLVDKQGNYVEHRTINSAHPLLEKAVTPHLGDLEFSPAIQGGKAIAFWVNIPFTFNFID
ncbi:MAG: energy transducer TonB [Bacteroidota bacterium]